MLQLFTKSILILIIAFAASFGIDMLYRHIYHLPYQTIGNIWIKPAIAQKYQIVKVGNSHSVDGISFEEYKLRSLSLASAAQSFEYDLAQLKMHSNQIDTGAIILINVSPMSFSQSKPRRTDSLQYKYYDGSLSPFFIPHLHVGNYLESRVFPFVRTVYLWREAYAQSVKDAAMETFASQWSKPTPEIPPPPKATSVPIASGQTTEIRKKKHIMAQEELALEPYQSDERLKESVHFMVEKWHNLNDFDPYYFDSNSKDLEELIRYSQKKKWRPVLISIPISQRLMNELGPTYMQGYLYQPLKKTNTHGCDFFDFLQYTDMQKNAHFFTNSDHLSSSGARIFSHLLLERLIEQKYLAPEVDIYQD